jgi:WD40 repeat protein
LAHSAIVREVLVSPNGRSLVTACDDKNVRLWDVATGRLLCPPLEHEREPRAMAFSPDGMLLVTGSRGGSARLWDASTGQPLGPPMQHCGPIHVVAFSPDGTTLLTGGSDALAWLWPVPAREAGSVELVALETQVRSGLALEGEMVRVLDARTWQETRERLRILAGE